MTHPFFNLGRREPLASRFHDYERAPKFTKATDWWKTDGSLLSSSAAPVEYGTVHWTAMLRRWVATPRPWARFLSDAKRERLPVELRDEDLVESFVKGWGKGGQKINKVRNCVLLKHVPTGLHVRCQETRSLDGNRRIARRLLLQKLDDHVNGELSKRSVKIDKLRKKKANRRSKSKQKYAAKSDQDSEEGEQSGSDSEGDDDGADDDDSDGDYDHEDDVEVVEFDVDEHKFRSKKK